MSIACLVVRRSGGGNFFGLFSADQDAGGKENAFTSDKTMKGLKNRRSIFMTPLYFCLDVTVEVLLTFSRPGSSILTIERKSWIVSFIGGLSVLLQYCLLLTHLAAENERKISVPKQLSDSLSSCACSSFHYYAAIFARFAIDCTTTE